MGGTEQRYEEHPKTDSGRNHDARSAAAVRAEAQTSPGVQNPDTPEQRSVASMSSSVSEQSTASAKYDLDAPPESKIDDPPKLKPGFESKPSPFLAVHMERGLAVTVAKELFEADERRREKNRLRIAQKRDENRQEYNDYMREYMSKRAARLKEQKSPASSPASPPKNTKR